MAYVHVVVSLQGKFVEMVKGWVLVLLGCPPQNDVSLPAEGSHTCVDSQMLTFIFKITILFMDILKTYTYLEFS